MKQARINTATGEVLETRTVGARPTVANQWVTLTDEPRPPYDPDTETLDKTSATTSSGVTRGFRARPLTDQEMGERQTTNAIKEAEKDDRNNLRAIVTTLEEGGATSRQVQKALARIIKLLYKPQVE